MVMEFVVEKESLRKRLQERNLLSHKRNMLSTKTASERPEGRNHREALK